MTTLQKQIKKTADKINEFRGKKGFQKIKEFCEWLKQVNGKFEITYDSDIIYISYTGKKESLDWYVQVNRLGGFLVGDEIIYHLNNSDNSNDAIKYLIEDLKVYVKGIPTYLIKKTTPNIVKVGKFDKAFIESIKEIVSCFKINKQDIPVEILKDTSIGIRTHSYISISRLGELYKLNYLFYSTPNNLKNALIEKLINNGAEIKVT